jgi:simple sugar transport system permease protein
MIWPFIARSLEIATILILAGIGELLTERSGVINVGIEGLMLLGAASGFLATISWGLIPAFIVGTIFGGLFGLLHAILSVSMKVNQVVSGMGIWLFAMGFVTYWTDRYSGPLPRGILSPRMYELSPVFFIAIAIVAIIWFTLSRTHLGLKIKSVGENPFAAEVSGIHVVRTRYLCTIIGGMLSGLAGAFLSTTYLAGWSHLPTKGLGWIAFALVMFSLWRPAILLAGALIFGFVWQFAISPETIYAGIPAPLPILRMLPFIATIAVLVVISTERFRRKWALAKPESLGEPYIKE